MLFITSDTHFGHANIIKYCKRPFADVEEMNETLVANWNAVVSSEDEVWHLGDLALGKAPDIIAIGRQLNGKKYLLRGNHDRNNWSVYAAAGFKQAMGWGKTAVGTKHIGDFGYLYFSHRPPTDEQLQKTYARLWIHGHTHSTHGVMNRLRPRTMDMSVEGWDYAPVAWPEIVKTAENAWEAWAI